MLQKGNDVINGTKSTNLYPHTNNNSQLENNAAFEGSKGNLVQIPSFEDYVPLECTLLQVETFLPRYIPNPLHSPSVNISTITTTVTQLQHQTLAPPQLQHNQML